MSAAATALCELTHGLYMAMTPVAYGGVATGTNVALPVSAVQKGAFTKPPPMLPFLSDRTNVAGCRVSWVNWLSEACDFCSQACTSAAPEEDTPPVPSDILNVDALALLNRPLLVRKDLLTQNPAFVCGFGKS